MVSEHAPTYVPGEFHAMVRELERAHRDLARREAGAPLEPTTDPLRDSPRTASEAYSVVCLSRAWLYEWVQEHCNPGKKEHQVAVKFR